MADVKISALPASTTPLAGTEVLPIVQSGATKQVSVANLTAGRAISATAVTASTGNFVIGTAGQGIDFSINPNPGGMTSELLNDYEEGTWTPVPVPTSGAITTYSSTGIYTKVGRQVTLTFNITISNAGTAVALSSITGIPFTNGGVVAPGCGREAGVTGAMWQYTVGAGATSIVGKAYTNDPSIVSGYILYGSVTYTV